MGVRGVDELRRAATRQPGEGVANKGVEQQVSGRHRDRFFRSVHRYADRLQDTELVRGRTQ